MNSILHILIACIFFTLVSGLGGCSNSEANLSSSTPTPTPTPTVATAPTPEAPETTANPTPTPFKEPTAPSDTIPITVYQANSQCQDLVPTKIAVPTQQSLDFAIVEVLKQQDNLDFPLAYRLEVNPDYQTATIDLRVATTATRPLTALSSCEQLAVFGGLRETLTRNPEWQIQEVYFTSNGEEIVF